VQGGVQLECLLCGMRLYGNGRQRSFEVPPSHCCAFMPGVGIAQSFGRSRQSWSPIHRHEMSIMSCQVAQSHECIPHAVVTGRLSTGSLTGIDDFDAYLVVELDQEAQCLES